MSKGDIAILGAGGHARVVASTWLACGGRVTAFYDDDAAIHGSTWMGIPVAGPIASWARQGAPPALIGVGSNGIRRRIAETYPDTHWETAVHPSAVRAEDVELGPGTVVFAGSVLQPGVRLGSHVIVNTRCGIDHDCRIQDFAHVGPGGSLCGGVEVGADTLVGVGASVAPLVKVGAAAVVGAGASVVNDVADGLTVVGVPARPKGNT